MKLRLSQNKDVAVLDVLENVTVQHIAVLKAGVGKLLKSGRNKIVLNLIEAKTLALDAVVAVIQLHQAAKELNGEIVLVGQGELVMQAIKTFPTPPTVRCFSSVDAALASIKDEKKNEKKTEVIGAPNDLKNQISQLETENKALKEKLKARNIDELKKIKTDNAVLRDQIQGLEAQLQAAVKDKKAHYGLGEHAAKYQELETALEGFLKQYG